MQGEIDAGGLREFFAQLPDDLYFAVDKTEMKISEETLAEVRAVSEARNEEREREHQESISPVERTFMESSLRVEFDVWMVDNFGYPKDMDGDEATRWYERNGIGQAFITHLFSEV